MMVRTKRNFPTTHLPWQFQLPLVRLQGSTRLAIFHEVPDHCGEVPRGFCVGFYVLLILWLMDSRRFLVQVLDCRSSVGSQFLSNRDGEIARSLLPRRSTVAQLLQFADRFADRVDTFLDTA